MTEKYSIWKALVPEVVGPWVIPCIMPAVTLFLLALSTSSSAKGARTGAPLAAADESLTETWLERLAAQKAANVDLGLPTSGSSVSTGDKFVSYPFTAFSKAYVAKALAEGADWRTKNAVTPVKSQGSHGVCGTFGQTQSAESQYALGGGGANPAKKPNKLTQFSEQQVLSCKCQKVVTPSCGGSTHSDAWIFYGQAPVPGLESAQSYPFNQSSAWPDSSPPPCHFSKSDVLPNSVFSNTTTITHQQSSGDNYGQLEAMLHFNGPMQIGINAGVFKYKTPHGQASGVEHWVNESGCAAAAAAGLHSIDHSLGVVGFGTDKVRGDYWIIKNSWGETWGDQGFVKVSRKPGLWCGNLFASGAHTYTYGDPKYYYEQSSE